MKTLLFAFLLFSASFACAQQAPIAIVSSNGTTKLTSSIDSAAILAQDNDIIYLPGGALTGQSTRNFDKKVTIIGVGHHPDSTAATGRTFIDGNLIFYLGGEGSVVDGVYISGDLYVMPDMKIYRSNMNSAVTHCAGYHADNVVAMQCVFRSGFMANPCTINNINNAIVKNCVFGNASNLMLYRNYNSVFENCIFLKEGTYDFAGISQCTFRNCTFTGITGWVSPVNSFFFNNVFTSAGVPPLTDSSNASGNYVNQTASLTFTVPPPSTYSYANNYTINGSSPGHLGGTDGKDVGIYGGTTPWTLGNIPPNPTIRMKNVDAQTQSNGTLRVRFDVRGQ